MRSLARWTENNVQWCNLKTNALTLIWVWPPGAFLSRPIICHVPDEGQRAIGRGPIPIKNNCRMAQLAARRAHNAKVDSSSLSPATSFTVRTKVTLECWICRFSKQRSVTGGSMQGRQSPALNPLIVDSTGVLASWTHSRYPR